MADYRTHIQVLTHHCDATGVVNFSRYGEMAYEVVERWFDEALDWSFWRMHHGEDLAVPIVSAQSSFPAASRSGDHLIWRLSVVSIGRSSLDLSLSATCGGEARASIDMSLVLSEVGFTKPRAWPDTARARIADYITGIAAD
ncbi:thioesterase family protein [Cognatishimia sp. F0-27]|uniref:acyl-CoA thioesterase n=1 Tax=Cognatishimia sp. F0-27 TaxID=2816855 RepID=UPI001D0C4BA3|nr:thioesterase family protein [Cognatishimia sp. F0-27]MCC1492635.1 acyl-CoA thioesterase [Cognatishimia sp. F0-27]